VGDVAGLSRAACRRAFENRFDASRMAEGYLQAYRRLTYSPSEVEEAAQVLEMPQRIDRRARERARFRRSGGALLGIVR